MVANVFKVVPKFNFFLHSKFETFRIRFAGQKCDPSDPGFDLTSDGSNATASKAYCVTSEDQVQHMATFGVAECLPNCDGLH